MAILTLEGVVENGQIRLPDEVALPEHAKVYVVIPTMESARPAHGRSAGLAHSEQVAYFAKQVLEVPPGCRAMTHRTSIRQHLLSPVTRFDHCGEHLLPVSGPPEGGTPTKIPPVLVGVPPSGGIRVGSADRLKAGLQPTIPPVPVGVPPSGGIRAADRRTG